MHISVLKGETRAGLGGRATGRLRREGWVPAVLYGHGEENVHFRVREDDITQLIQEGHHMMSLDLGGQASHSLLKDIQFDTLGERVIHVDFARVDLDEVVTTSVPLRIHGSPKGVAAGGVLDVAHHELEIRGKVLALPEYLEVEIGELLIGQSVRARELVLPSGVTVLLDPEDPVVLVHAPKVEVAPIAVEAVAEPEVIGAKPAETAGEEKGEKTGKPEKPGRPEKPGKPERQ